MDHWDDGTHEVVIVHDYLTQCGGAERVVLALAKAFPNAPILTSLYCAAKTYPEFAALPQLRTSILQRVWLFREYHRLAFLFYAPIFSRVELHAEIVICSTSGWAHAVNTTGQKVLYVYNPARWLYQPDEYMIQWPPAARKVVAIALSPLRRWDRRAARSADYVIAISSVVQERIMHHWGVNSIVLYPPHTANEGGPQAAIAGLSPGYLLVVSRLLPYKRIAAIVEAVRRLPHFRLVIVGTGPDGPRLAATAPETCILLGQRSDEELRWIYANSYAVIAAADEDFGLVPLEAMSFGKPVVALRRGGFVETVVDGLSGLFFDEPVPDAIADAISRLDSTAWDAAAIRAHADLFSEGTFVQKIRNMVTAKLSGAGSSDWGYDVGA